MKYPITTVVTILAAIILFYYIYMRYTNYGKIVYMETKLSYIFRRHKSAIMVLLLLFFIMLVSFNIESEWDKLKKIVAQYTKVRNYLVTLATDKTKNPPEETEEHKNLLRIQYTTGNYSLRSALKDGKWGIAVEIMDDMLERKNPYIRKLIEAGCKAGETSCVFFGGKPVFGLIKYMQPSRDVSF